MGEMRQIFFGNVLKLAEDLQTNPDLKSFYLQL